MRGNLDHRSDTVVAAAKGPAGAPAAIAVGVGTAVAGVNPSRNCSTTLSDIRSARRTSGNIATELRVQNLLVQTLPGSKLPRTRNMVQKKCSHRLPLPKTISRKHNCQLLSGRLPTLMAVAFSQRGGGQHAQQGCHSGPAVAVLAKHGRTCVAEIAKSILADGQNSAQGPTPTQERRKSNIAREGSRRRATSRVADWRTSCQTGNTTSSMESVCPWHFLAWPKVIESKQYTRRKVALGTTLKVLSLPPKYRLWCMSRLSGFLQAVLTCTCCYCLL